MGTWLMLSPGATWFGSDFRELHPLLQALHVHGGRLVGSVQLRFPADMAGRIGRRIAASIGMPTLAGEYPLEVEVSHDHGRMHWSRRFGEFDRVLSIFTPVGTRATRGYWIEATGAIRLLLAVDIVESGWQWRCIGARYRGLPVPLMLIPKTRAHKRIQSGRYAFFVEISLPLIGPVLEYQGVLDLVAGDDRGA